MKVVYNWLKDFVDVAATPHELASRLALSGTNIAGMENGPHGAVIDAEVSSNRPDCLGHYGIAREVAAIYKLPLKHVSPEPVEGEAKAGDAVKVEIQSPELCGRFTARVIRKVKIQPSPKWLKDRLEASGVASISNVVDISNYVMLELGHPLHTFDYDKLRDHKIVVRRAKPGEKTRTLDGIERQLESNICMISDGDASRAVGIGGIMGGAETEISFSTKNVLIECAWFEAVAIRRAARFLKLHTEASTRFGRGADPEMAELASRRAAELILQLAGGELLSGVVDSYPGKRAPKKIRLTRAEILRVMGADVPDKQIEASLSALGFAPVRIDQNRAAAGPPLGLRSRHALARAAHRFRLPRDLDASARGRRARRAIPTGKCRSGAAFESAFGRGQRAALDWHRHHGKRDRMESESRPTQCAPVRNRPPLSLEWKRIGRNPRAHHRRDRRSPRKRSLRCSARFFLCRSQGRSRFHRRTLRRFPLGRRRRGMAARGAARRRQAKLRHFERREKSLFAWCRWAACTPPCRQIEIAARRFPGRVAPRSALRCDGCGERSAALRATTKVSKRRTRFFFVTCRRHEVF